MEKIILDLQFKAPYCKVGTVSKTTKTIWLIFHGYGQLAGEFTSSFSELGSEDHCLIFPQGLSKFYLKGVDKKIGANWMTSHDRVLDITNYVSYLNQLFEQEIKPYLDKVELNILGFSQGGHTASRWIYESNIKYNKFVLWGSGLANEIDIKIIKKSFSKGENLLVVGDRDRYIDNELLLKTKNRYKKIDFKYQLVEYKGGHEIYPEVLKLLN
jgi:predicted esterase